MRRLALLLAVSALRVDAQPPPSTPLADTLLPPPLRWLQQATLPVQHPHAGDLCSIGDELYIAASTDPLTANGQALYRISPDGRLTSVLKRSGQGFLRVHDLAGRVFVPDADAPFTASIVFRLNIDGFVYSFDPRAPDVPKREVLPQVYHVFDTALLEGRTYAACGAYASNEIPYRAKRNPAALYLREAEGKPWRRVLEYPREPKNVATGVVRFTYLLPMPSGAMLAGLTDWSRTVGGDQSFTTTDDAFFLLADGTLYRSENGTTFTALTAQNASLRHHTNPLLTAPLAFHRGKLWAADPQDGTIWSTEP